MLLFHFCQFSTSAGKSDQRRLRHILLLQPLYRVPVGKGDKVHQDGQGDAIEAAEDLWKGTMENQHEVQGHLM